MGQNEREYWKSIEMDWCEFAYVQGQSLIVYLVIWLRQSSKDMSGFSNPSLFSMLVYTQTPACLSFFLLFF